MQQRWPRARPHDIVSPFSDRSSSQWPGMAHLIDRFWHWRPNTPYCPIVAPRSCSSTRQHQSPSISYLRAASGRLTFDLPPAPPLRPRRWGGGVVGRRVGGSVETGSAAAVGSGGMWRPGQACPGPINTAPAWQRLTAARNSVTPPASPGIPEGQAPWPAYGIPEGGASRPA